VLDHRERVAYACRSPRTSEALVVEWARLMDFEPCVFDAANADGIPVYHTNVVMWLGADIAGVGLPWVPEPQRAKFAARLRASGRDILELEDAQLHAFAGNMLEVPAPGAPRLLMSARAAASLHDAQRRQIAAAGVAPLAVDLPVIEQLGGGSIRCMVAEVPLPAQAPAA